MRCLLVWHLGIMMYQAVRSHYKLSGSHTYSVRAFCFGRRVCRLSVPGQISKTKRDRREISSLL